MSAVGDVAARTAAIVRKLVLWLGIALLVLVGLVGASPPVVPLAHVALWHVTGDPPLHFGEPHDGQVVAHIEVGVMGVDISRIRITNTIDNTVVWDVRPLSNRSECWNSCWNLTFQVGPNPASFTAGPQSFVAHVPQGATFSLSQGTPYLFEVWDGKGRVGRDRFKL